MSDARLGVADAIALVLAGVGVVAVWAVQLFAVPAFAAMFEDFDASQPRLTRAVISPVVALACTAIVVVCSAGGTAARLARPTRLGTVLLAIAAAAPMVAVPLILYALYLPIFEIADAIRE